MRLASVLVNAGSFPLSYEPPTPPSELPTDPIEILNDYAPEKLQHVAQNAEELAEYKNCEARFAEDDEDEMDERTDDVPVKATITINEINVDRYHYWQYRGRNRATSRYRGRSILTSKRDTV